MLYKAVEQYAPELFEEIRRLTAQGKWHIMGGWYLQPDCNMPSGESIVRQCMMGHRYFEEKFGVWPTTAVNMDPFGHHRGLVQILAKCGQDSYLCVRPFAGQMAWPVEYNGKNQPNYERFRWIGYDDKSSLLVQKSFSYMCCGFENPYCLTDGKTVFLEPPIILNSGVRPDEMEAFRKVKIADHIS